MLLGVGQTFDDTITDFSFVFLFLFFCLFFSHPQVFPKLGPGRASLQSFPDIHKRTGLYYPSVASAFSFPSSWVYGRFFSPGSTGVVADPFAFKRCFDRRFCLSVAKGRYSTGGGGSRTSTGRAVAFDRHALEATTVLSGVSVGNGLGEIGTYGHRRLCYVLVDVFLPLHRLYRW